MTVGWALSKDGALEENKKGKLFVDGEIIQEVLFFCDPKAFDKVHRDPTPNMTENKTPCGPRRQGCEVLE